MCAAVTLNTHSNTPSTTSADSAWWYVYATIVVVVNCVATILCACAMTCWIVTLLEGRRQRRELRDKVGNIVSTLYWPVEGDISRLLLDVETMRCVALYRDITAFDVLAFKYRFRRRVLDDSYMSNFVSGFEAASNPFQTLRRVERLLDSLALLVPVRGRSPDQIALPFGRTLCGLVRATAAVWSDDRAPTVRRLMRFFGGSVAAAGLDAARVSDATLQHTIESRLPYVDALRLFGNRFVLDEMGPSSEVSAFDARAKVRYIDEHLAEPDVCVFAARQWRQTLVAYRAGCDLCVGAGLIPSRSLLPDFTLEMGEDDERVSNCVTLLHHMVRLMCGVEENVRRLGSDDQFLRFIAGLHDIVCTWTDGPVSLSVMACIERSRANIAAYTRKLTVDQICIDAELTRAMLEGVENELHRHLNYLTVQRVKSRRREAGDHCCGEGPSGLSGTPGTAAAAPSEGALHLGESETSIYTMAVSYMSPAPRQHHVGAVSASPKRFDPSGLVQLQSAERVSLLSGVSSMYATAASLSSANNNDADSASLRFSPGMPRFSPPAARSTGLLLGTSGSAQSESDGEYFETPV